METTGKEKDMNQNEEIISENQEVTDNLPESQNAAESPVQAEEKLKAELAEQKDKYLRLYSEFENFRRRTAKEKSELIMSANEQLLKALIPVVDDFERAEKSFGSKKDDKEFEGFFLIQNKFKKTLDQTGLKPMDIKPGADFNADLHEAITQIPAPDEKLKGKIVDVIENGYFLNDKVIRFAKVVVGS